MGATTRTINTTPASTNEFQNLLYNSVLHLTNPNAGVMPDYANSAYFEPSSLTRTGAMAPYTGPSGIVRPPIIKVPENPTTPSSVLSASDLPIYGGRVMNAQATPRGYTNSGGRTGTVPVDTNPDGTPRTALPRGTADVGGIQGVLDFLSQMYAATPGTNGLGTAIAPLPTYNTASATAATGLAPTLGTLTRQPGETDEQYNLRARGFNTQQNQYSQLIDAIMASAGGMARGASGGYTPANITAPTISTEGTQTQSADQIAQGVMGENSMFTKNILPAYNNLFNTQNALTAAAAKESAGNLTGSGFANTMATALNRNNSTQQALLADTLNKLVSQEIGRQTTGAQLAGTRNIEQAQMGLTAQTTSAQLAQQAQALKIQAMASGNQAMLAAAEQLAQKAALQAQLEQQMGIVNVGNAQQTGLFNAGEENAANATYFTAGVNRNQRQAEMDAARQNLMYSTTNQNSQFNSEQFMRLLQMLFTGGAQNTAVTSGGIGAALPGLFNALATYMALA